MNKRVTIGTSLGLAVLLLTGCDDVYYQKPDARYGYGGVSDRRLVDNCQRRVDDKVEWKFDNRVYVEYGYADLEDISRHRVRVRGDATVRDRGDRYRLRYHCDLDAETGRVAEMDIDWRDRPHHDRDPIDPGLVHNCQDKIRKQVQSDTAAHVSLEFRDYKTEKLSKKRSQVTGKAKVKASHGDGAVQYECVTRSKPRQVERASYHWADSLPSNDKKIKKLCHDTIRNRIKGDGYKKVKFKSTEVKDISRTERRVRGSVNMRRSGNKYQASYECQASINKNQIGKAGYKVK